MLLFAVVLMHLTIGLGKSLYRYRVVLGRSQSDGHLWLELSCHTCTT